MTIMTLLSMIGKGAAIAFPVASVASNNNVRVSVNGQFIHHSIGGLVVMVIAGVLGLTKTISSEISAGVFGFGAGLVVHDVITDRGCDGGGVCLTQLQRGFNV